MEMANHRRSRLGKSESKLGRRRAQDTTPIKENEESKIELKPSMTNIKIKGPTVPKREYMIGCKSAQASSLKRRTMPFFAPRKLVPTVPKDSTVYDFNSYGPRPELFPVKIETHADYAMGAQRAQDDVCAHIKVHRAHSFARSSKSACFQRGHLIAKSGNS